MSILTKEERLRFAAEIRSEASIVKDLTYTFIASEEKGDNIATVNSLSNIQCSLTKTTEVLGIIIATIKSRTTN